jgi:hypothetical protein
MTIFLGPSHLVPKHELSSRPERSEVEVLSTSQWLLNESDTLPLCHPERSREPALSEFEWGSAVLSPCIESRPRKMDIQIHRSFCF